VDTVPGDTSHAREPRRVWSFVGLVAGSVMALLGMWLVGAYFMSAVLDRVGEPDQSLLFWYLPLLFVGIMAVAAGVTIGILSSMGLRKAN